MKIINLTIVLVYALLINSGVNADWSDAADKTKDAAKEVGSAAGESSSKAWNKTKEVSSDSWDKTKKVSSDVWNKAKGIAHDGAEYVSEKTK